MLYKKINLFIFILYFNRTKSNKESSEIFLKDEKYVYFEYSLLNPIMYMYMTKISKYRDI